MSLDVPEPIRQELDEARRAYDTGNFALARKKARTLLLSADVPEEARKEALTLDGLTRPDPVSYAILAGCLVLFLLVIVTYVL